jgi:CheY-like chemotaxis protein
MPTILVLDDDQVILDLFQTVLTDAGYDTVVGSGLHGIPPIQTPTSSSPISFY